jgi:hypothetical protein
LQNELAERTVSSNDLINAYTINEEKSDRLYTGKIYGEVMVLLQRNFVFKQRKYYHFK